MTTRQPGLAHRAARLVCLVLLSWCAFASASPVRWNVSNASFDDSGSISGYFIYDVDTNHFSEWAVSVANGHIGDFPPITFGPANSVASTTNLGNPQPTLVFQLQGSQRVLRMTPNAALTNGGGSVAINITTQGLTGSVETYSGSGGPSRGIVSGRFDGTPAGSSFTIRPGITGNWYDPAQNGHGFQLEILPNGVATAFWFTFDNAGNAVWINGAGNIQGDRVVMNAGRVLNGRFPPNFNPATIERRPWGTLTFTFTDCNNGRVDWNSTDSAFTPAGMMQLQRLTAIDGVGCP
ncbi:hypothetical protein [Tahibacter amnicola]|uniref:PA14 domain-containing protein n=1 Tax=Tahibacter amnicola TaxID=2976241 RepID=A0ABY6BJT3_9GAMM|nr:hypothetical protein [Tahibacter amnicola]UXI70278.1 hypothetical protein N4264_11775 [Tahibacter amnicola]